MAGGANFLYDNMEILGDGPVSQIAVLSPAGARYPVVVGEKNMRQMSDALQ